MLIEKTEDFAKHFFLDLKNIVWEFDYIKKLKAFLQKGKYTQIGPRENNPFSRGNIRFFGSFFEKPIGSNITDIDLIQLIPTIKPVKVKDKKSLDLFFQRLKKVLTNLDKTNFIFIRFYCGYIEGLEPPWRVGDEGDCKFNYQKLVEYLKFTKDNYPDIYKLINFLEKDSLSINDLIKASSLLEPFISLKWSRDEIIKGKKIYKNKTYDLLECMQNYSRYQVIKFAYKYENKYCFVDYNIISRDNSIESSSSDFITYYTEDLYKMYKYLKKMLKPEYYKEYIDDRKKAIGDITPLAALLEVYDKFSKYKIISENLLSEMKEKIDSIKNSLNIDINYGYSDIQNIIKNKIEMLYYKYKNHISEKYKPVMFRILIRKKNIDKQISVNILKNRENKPQYDCAFFELKINDIDFIYSLGNNSLIDPEKIYDCIQLISNSLKKEDNEILKCFDIKKKFYIKKINDDLFDLYSKDRKIISGNKLQLKIFQKLVLFGLPK